MFIYTYCCLYTEVLNSFFHGWLGEKGRYCRCWNRKSWLCKGNNVIQVNRDNVFIGNNMCQATGLQCNVWVNSKSGHPPIPCKPLGICCCLWSNTWSNSPLCGLITWSNTPLVGGQMCHWPSFHRESKAADVGVIVLRMYWYTTGVYSCFLSMCLH